MRGCVLGSCLCSLSLPADRDLTDGSKFLWWLWVANLGPRLSQVVGDGIVLAELREVQADCGEVLTSFTRNHSVCFVRLSLDQRGNVKVRHWVETLLAPSRASEQAEQQEQVSDEEEAV